MRHDKLERELELLILLAENRSNTVEMLCQRLGISRRNFYYYLEFFRDCGFILEKHGQCYSIDRMSPFFSRLFDRIAFTENEAVTLRQLLANADQHNAVLEGIRRKLDRFYDFDILANDELRQRTARHVGIIYEAIKLKQMVMLKNYSSPHGRSQRNRVVEPFLLMNNNNEVRCYEPQSDMNKTFKLARMEDVQLLDLRWSNEDRHRQMFTFCSKNTPMPLATSFPMATTIGRSRCPFAAIWASVVSYSGCFTTSTFSALTTSAATSARRSMKWFPNSPQDL